MGWGGAKKLALQSVTKGGVTALSEGYVIYGRSLRVKERCLFSAKKSAKICKKKKRDLKHYSFG